MAKWTHKELNRVKVKRGGFDVTVEFSNPTIPQRFTKTFYFISETQIKTGFEERMKHAEDNLQDSIDQAAYEAQWPSMFTREDVEKILIEKKYLSVGQKFEDLPVNQVAERGVV